MKVIHMINEKVDLKRVSDKLSGAIRIKTISHEDESLTDWKEFDRFHDYLRESFPLLHKNLTLETVGKAGLFYFWEGTDKTLDPIAFLAHQDVVPVAQGTDKDWEHPAFEGYNDGKFIWGRGALDMKNHLISVMESIELLLEEGYKPTRSVYLCFGYNEEIVAGKDNAAKMIAKALKDKGVHLDSLVDEGGAMIPIKIPGAIDTVLSGIGIGEKGYADFKVTVNSKGGHSSAPPKHTGIGVLSKKIRNLENHQFPAEMPDYFLKLIQALGDKSAFWLKPILKNADKYKNLITFFMAKNYAGASFVRSCQAVTMASGSPTANVLPQKASCIINFRMYQGLTIDDCRRHIEKYMGGKNVTVELLKGKEASEVAPTDTRAFETLSKLIVENNPKSAVTPFMIVGGTDAYNYECVCENIYRFAPFEVSANLMLTTHSTNERIPVEQLGKGVAFFKHYIREMTAG